MVRWKYVWWCEIHSMRWPFVFVAVVIVTSYQCDCYNHWIPVHTWSARPEMIDSPFRTALLWSINLSRLLVMFRSPCTLPCTCTCVVYPVGFTPQRYIVLWVWQKSSDGVKPFWNIILPVDPSVFVILPQKHLVHNKGYMQSRLKKTSPFLVSDVILITLKPQMFVDIHSASVPCNLVFPFRILFSLWAMCWYSFQQSGDRRRLCVV